MEKGGIEVLVGVLQKVASSGTARILRKGSERMLGRDRRRAQACGRRSYNVLKHAGCNIGCDEKEVGAWGWKGQRSADALCELWCVPLPENTWLQYLKQAGSDCWCTLSFKYFCQCHINEVAS